MALNGFAASLFAFGRKANKLKRPSRFVAASLFAFVVGWLGNSQNDAAKILFFWIYGTLYPNFLYFCRV